MKNIIVISDYIEGQPVVASVRYVGIMTYLKEKHDVLALSNAAFSKHESKLAPINYKFTTPDSRFSQDFTEGARAWHPAGGLGLIVRNRFTTYLWRNYKYSETGFNRLNKSFYSAVSRYLAVHQIDAIYITVPDIYGLYIIKHIKRKYKHIPVLIEIRDLIHHQIGAGNPTYMFKKAERLICKYADGIIALSQGIMDHYKAMNHQVSIKLIRNGYDEQYFLDSHSVPLRGRKELIMAHIGSVYKGRNIKDFIEGLKLFHGKTGIKAIFNIVGILDHEALQDIGGIPLDNGVQVNIIGTVKHEQAIEYLKECDVAVILTHKKGSDYAIPGKTFEYIGACKPILAVTEDEELISLIDAKFGECARHNIHDIAEKLSAIYNREYDFSNRFLFTRTAQVNEIHQMIEAIQ